MSPDAIGLFWLASVIAAVHFYLLHRHKKVVAYSVHVQARTEEAETMDFSVVLLDGETKEQWQAKLDKAFWMSEKRRSHNNERILEIMNIEKEKLKAVKS